MVHLRPASLSDLLRRLHQEWTEERAIYGLPERKMFTGYAGLDLSTRFHDQHIATPFGPAAGPQTQMAQNLVLSWLAGARVLELKTVQVLDQLDIPRPCIDVQHVGYNIEWSQELSLEESIEEYVKGAMIIELLFQSGLVSLPDDDNLPVFDMSVGYDLAGIQSDTVRAFLAGMDDCSAIVERLRREIPDEFAAWRDIDFRTHLSDTLTLSTFHGCLPEEITAITRHLMEDHGLHTVVKLNPTLLGAERVRHLIGEVMGFDEIRIPQAAFDEDTTWEAAVDLVNDLAPRARELGLGFGVKFTNSLVIENHRDVFDDSVERMYLSGPPLHLLAMALVADFREHFGAEIPVSFSAGIDARNFAPAVSLGLVPITVCTDMLKPGGYGRAHGYLDNLARSMEEVGAQTIDEFILLSRGLDPSGERKNWPEDPEIFASLVRDAAALNTEDYFAEALADPRYSKDGAPRPPRKIGSDLELFDCITCFKCIPVCPNNANFAYRIAPVPGLAERAVQFATFADFCNDCGNCDPFCPEDGGPYLVKPLFFGSRTDFEACTDRDGFCLDGTTLIARVGGDIFQLNADDSTDLSASQVSEMDPDILRTLLLYRDAVAGAIAPLGRDSQP
jgi:putative selenate reductase